ncbi:helicase HerA-like domain-containing protein [Chitinimonas sp. JJ19]|uniref:helicase HerA-like domain-containing protein n=1 Tax=Chitinimonas sp. JJ19 TaxID=3109352 RepID=UPI003001218A
MTAALLIAKAGPTPIEILPALANRHGLITGATGTGKTVTLQRMAEGFSRAGVPVFMADVKGDLAGIAAAGSDNPKLSARLAQLEVQLNYAACPAMLWDVYGEAGHPVRATISDMGPLLLGRLLNLNEVQAGVLQLIFKIADDNSLLLIDLKDLRAMVQYVGENAKQFTTEYGNISAASVGAIQRGLLTLETQGGDKFFGEPMLDIADLMQTDGQGHGVVNILAADKLTNAPKLYSTFLLWLLSELFEQLPEAGDLDKPKLVFFFDEAHLLFNDAPPALVEKVEQVVRLIRSKGVGVYFVTQNPLDIPETVLGQLGNRVQHALRAFTPRDQKAVKVAAETLRANPAFNAEAAIMELGVGEALVSFLDAKGSPSVVERAFVIPPACRLGPLSQAERQTLIANSLLAGHYEAAEDRESAYEKLRGSKDGTTPAKPGLPAQAAPAEAEGGGLLDGLGAFLFGRTGPRGGQHDGVVQSAAKSMARTMANEVGRQILRGVLGSIVGGRKR